MAREFEYDGQITISCIPWIFKELCRTLHLFSDHHFSRNALESRERLRKSSSSSDSELTKARTTILRDIETWKLSADIHNSNTKRLGYLFSPVTDTDVQTN